ncbi:hypothetical protein SAMN05216327_101224 [Dyadobacter sp. SG02]|uniref:hypothetical protein n=1 Tax=Dyadobacter sp. SG02 TaxID=1855291 RepID=UPI0008C8FDE6|nr:hypothetical protein [Dyadobacter sp. SG02]SEI39745.1 hypothetical protein SAMN05216327_101224 [Dyadobacter sp. SG02]
MKNVDTSDVHLLRKKTLWEDEKGRTLLIIDKGFEGWGPTFKWSEVEFFILNPITFVRRPYDKMANLIRAGRMKYIGECPTEYSQTFKH